MELFSPGHSIFKAFTFSLTLAGSRIQNFLNESNMCWQFGIKFAPLHVGPSHLFVEMQKT